MWFVSYAYRFLCYSAQHEVEKRKRENVTNSSRKLQFKTQKPALSRLQPQAHFELFTHTSAYPHLLRGDQTVLRPDLNAIDLVALFHNKLFRLLQTQLQNSLDVISVYDTMTNANIATSTDKGSSCIVETCCMWPGLLEH